MNMIDKVMIVSEFAQLHATLEKDRISQDYMTDVIDSTEFFELASNYLAHYKALQKQEESNEKI